ncbi:MAG: putative zinc-binding protein [candidate division WOR-3 bacterium]
MTGKQDEGWGTSNDTCCSDVAKTLIVACSGSSNVGQISNNLMIELHKSGHRNAFCLAAIGAGHSGFVETAKAARTIIIDGCATGCGKKVFDTHGIQATRHIVVTEFGVEKTHNFETVPAETKDLLAKLLQAI